MVFDICSYLDLKCYFKLISSYDYKQPNIRFDETPTKAPYIQVTPKNTPKTTTLSHHLPSGYSKFTTTTPTPPTHSHVHSLRPKVSPSYAPAPYR